MKKIGLIVNPIAGMGGAVGLKGTDGEMYEKARELGAEQKTPKRTSDFLDQLEHRERMLFLVASGRMGADYIRGFGLDFEEVGDIEEETAARDTREIAKEMLARGIDILVFVGGDGTCRDVLDAVGTAVPVIAVPSGVKVFSSAFAVSPGGAADMLDGFIEGSEITEQEVLDIDEDAFREDQLASRLYGYLLVPEAEEALQEGKQASSTDTSSVKNKKEIANETIQNFEEDTLYLLGPGTTLKAITDELELPKTLLGIDAVINGVLAGSDLNEADILELLRQYSEVKIIVTPIGGNGFIFGRGSKQFTPEVIKKVGSENVLVVGDKAKVNKLDCLRVDTGEVEVDELFGRSMEVTVGRSEKMVMEVRS